MDILLYISLISGVVNCLPLNNHPLFKEEEYDVTLLKNPISRKYYVNPAEFGKYEQQFSKIKSLGEEIECKLSGMCAGKKRGDISSKTEKLQNNPGKKKSFDSMLEEESKGAELQLNAPYRRKNLYEKSNDIQSQFISVENMNTPPYGGARNPPASLGGEKKTRFGGKMHYTQQPDAEMYGQQPQMDIEMPMDPQFLKQDRPGVNAGHENMPGGGTSSMIGGQMSGGMGPMGFPDQEQGPPVDMPDEEAAPSVEEQSKMQSDQLENSIQQSLAHKMRFLESANGPPSPSVGRNEQQISQLSRFSQDSPYGNEMEGKDAIEKGKESPLENEEESKARETEQNYSPFNRKDAPADMNSFLDASTRDTPSPDFVEENAQMALQSNSDYQVPGSAFSSLWKSFLLTTQSQLGESDPSANSREGINKPQGQKSPPSKKKANKNHKKEQ